MPRYRTRDGRYTVETVQLSGTPDRHDGEWIRVRYCGFCLADVRKIPDLERYVALAELVDDDGVRYQPVSRDERAREGQRGRPSSRASGAREMTIGARLARVLGLYDLGEPVVSRSARSRPGHASAL
jgi:hypothetical protein